MKKWHKWTKEFKTNISFADENNNLFEEFYKKHVKKFVSSLETEDREHQIRGIDRIIFTRMENLPQFTVEEKLRRIDYNDIMLQVWNNKEKRQKGWLYYTQADYIVYCFKQSKRFIVMDTKQLQGLWGLKQNEWVTKYGLKDIFDKYWITTNIIIPIEELKHCIICDKIL